MVTIISTVILLGVLIFVHELGHFLAAKATGVKVERFSLGFPPKMIGKKVGETEYLLSWVPLGGYVKMYGENPDEEGEVPPEMRHRSFSHKPTWNRFLIVFAGPGFNFFFAFLVYWVVISFTGLPHFLPVVGAVQDNMPASAAGLTAGDRVTSIDGRPVKYWEDVLVLVRDSNGREVEITVDRDGRPVSARLQPKMVVVQNIFGEDQEVPMIGIQVQGEQVFEPVNLLEAVYWGALTTYDRTKLIILSVVKLIQGSISAKTLAAPFSSPNSPGPRPGRG